MKPLNEFTNENYNSIKDIQGMVIRDSMPYLIKLDPYLKKEVSLYDNDKRGTTVLKLRDHKQAKKVIKHLQKEYEIVAHPQTDNQRGFASYHEDFLDLDGNQMMWWDGE